MAAAVKVHAQDIKEPGHEEHHIEELLVKDVVCEVCGAFGYKHLLVQCNNCKNSTRHRYCMNPVLYDGSSIEWLCEDCPPKHNEVVESLKWRGDDHRSIQSGLSSSIIDEPNVNRAEVIKESWSWGRRRHRSHKARRYSTWGHRRHRSRKARRESTDACTEHFPYGGTFNSSQMFVEENSELNDVEKEGESENDHLICDVARSHPCVMDDSCLTVPIMEQEDGSSHPSESAEQPYPLEVVSPVVSSHSPSGSALENEEQGTEAGLFASVNDVEQSHPSFTDKTTTTLSSEEHGDGSSPTLESWDQPYPLAVVKPWDDAPNTILGWKPSSNNSQPVQSSDLAVGNMDVLVPSECLDPRSISKIVEPSSYSNGGDSAVEKYQAERTEFLSGAKTVTPALDNVQESSLSAEPTSSSNGVGDSAGEKNSAERTGRLSGMETVTPALDNVQGSSTSTAKECLVSNVDNSDEANRSNKRFLCTVENEESQLEVLSHPNILSDKVHCIHDGLNESSDPKSGPKGRDTQNDVPRASVSAGKNVVCSQVSQREDVTSEALPSKNVSPCRAKQSSFKKQENRHTQHTKDQKTKLIMKDGNADPAQLKSRLSKQLLDTCLDASSELSSKTKEVNDDNDAEPRCSTSAETFGNVVPMKRKRLSLPYGEDAEAMQAEDSNPPSSENDGQARMNRRHVESGAMNQGRSAENHEEVLYPGNSNNQHVNNHTQTKKQRMANKDKKAPLQNPSVRCGPDDADQLASEAAVAEGHCSLSRMPVSAPSDQQHFICTQPIDRPYWTGIMKIGQEYISLAAHLSNEACKKVHKLSRSLPPVMKVTMHSKLKAWASRFEASELTAESIGLYFFSDNVRPNKDLDRLVQYVTDHSIVLKYVFGFSKLLIFPSALLPEQYQMFQGKHYLWGVFRRRGTSKVAAQVKQKISASHAAERVKHQDKVQGGMQDQEMPPPKGTMPSENPLSPDTVHDREMPLPNGAMPSLGTVHDIGTETDPGEHRCKVQGGTQDEEMPVSKDTMPSDNPPSPDTVHDQEMPLPKGTMPSENQPVPGTVHDVGTETDPGEHRKSHANSEAPPTRLIGLVVTQTPRAEQFIKDLENEGALVFAVKGLVKPGPVRHQAPSNAVGSQPTRDNRPPASEA